MKKKKSNLQWIMEFAGQKQKFYIISVVLAVLGSVCQIIPFIMVANIVKKLLNGNTNFNQYIGDCLIIAIFWALRVIFHSVSTSYSHKATFEVLANIRKRGLLKLERMPLGEVQHFGSGNIKNILIERVDSMETTLAHLIPEMSGNLCAVVTVLIYLFIIDWRMALVSLITFPIGMICFMCMMIGYQPNYERTVRTTKNLNDTAVEYIEGIEVIKVFGKAKSSYEKFVDVAKECAASYVDWMRKSNIFFTFAMNIMPATLITVLPIGAIFIKNGTLETADFVLIVILSMGLITPLLNCMAFSDDIAKMSTIIGEVTSIIDAEEMPRNNKSITEIKNNTVKLQNVHFGYTEQEVIHGIDVTFDEGTFNAIVGTSGGGKSTIVKLIASFWDVKDGSIKIGDTDIRQFSTEQYNKMIAYVSQDNFLFDDTIRENIRMGNLSATDEQVEQAAKDCGCYDFIMELENGFDTVVGTGGGHLSGGERQRICIARAMLKNAPIVILDEATAYTDPENEAIIQSSIAKLVNGKTLIVIAHRLSTITDADKIVVVDKGNIAGCGKHTELIDTCSIYSKLWNAHISAKDSL